jgi:cellulose synthase/poly-beta-1,6-N-acetylglucosamine synthase-like glycosyltransferase
MIWLAIAVVGVLLIQDFLLSLLWILCFKNHTATLSSNTLPKVTVLVACRDEAENLPSCLKALDGLLYPSEKLQFILGNDSSSDRTQALLGDWVGTRPNAILVEVAEALYPHTNGKANALHQMALQATGDLLLFTDADCLVPPSWVQQMAEAFSNTQAAYLTGVTTVGGDSVWDSFQRLDWLMTLGIIKILTDIGSAVTSMGNNMGIRASAYNHVGGFAGIGFSLTEDLRMAQALNNSGYKGEQLFSKGNLIITKGQPDLKALLSQRKRWMAGAMSLNLFWKAMMLFQVLFYPAILILIAQNLVIGFLAWFLKILLQTAFLKLLLFKIDQKADIRQLFGFEIYYMIVSWSTIVYYFWPSHTDWKGRKYT